MSEPCGSEETDRKIGLLGGSSSPAEAGAATEQCAPREPLIASDGSKAPPAVVRLSLRGGARAGAVSSQPLGAALRLGNSSSRPLVGFLPKASLQAGVVGIILC